jgi:hypothetical protein
MKTLTLLLLFALPYFSFAQDIADNNSFSGNATHVNVTATAGLKAPGANALPVKNTSVMSVMMEALHNRRPGMPLGVDCHFADQQAELTITANNLEPLIGHLAVGRLQFVTMDISPAMKNGSPYFEYTGTDGNVIIKRWLITGSNQLPYTPVSRREYLQAAKVELAAMKTVIIAAVKEKVPVRPAAVQEAEKKATIEQLKAMYTGVSLEIRMRQYLKNYRTDEQYLQDHIDNDAAGVDSATHLMNDLLTHMSPAELGKPAIVSVPAVDFNGFEDGHTDKMLVRMNPACFKGGLSAGKPQVLLVEWRYDASNAAAADMDQQLMAGFDAQALRAMLGK